MLTYAAAPTMMVPAAAGAVWSCFVGRSAWGLIGLLAYVVLVATITVMGVRAVIKTRRGRR